MTKIIECLNLETTLLRVGQKITPVDRVTFNLEKNEILGLVGESGCGKSLTCLSLTGLVPRQATIRCDRFSFDGCEVNLSDKSCFNFLRRQGISYIFQEAREYINPLFSIGHQITESLMRAVSLKKPEARKESLKLLEAVGLSPSKEYYGRFVHELSGGMNQRAMVALALSTYPKVLIADEPTTALDLATQSMIINLIRRLVQERGISVIWVTHDLSLIRDVAHRCAVMYAGRIIEIGEARQILKAPAHPYTQALLSCLPERLSKKRFSPIQGEVADFSELPFGCKFHPRCPFRMEICLKQEPDWTEIHHHQKAKCYLLQKT